MHISFSFFYPCLSLSLIHSYLISDSELWSSSLSIHSLNSSPSIHSLNSHQSSTSSIHQLSQPPISLKPMPPIASDSRCRLECLLVDIGYLIGKPMELANPSLLPTKLADGVLICDWWFFILFVIGDFVWFGLRKKIRDLVFFFFFPTVDWWWWWWWLWLWLWLMVEMVVVGAVDVFWVARYIILL